MSTPSSRTRPARGRTSPESTPNSVVLPAPFGPDEPDDRAPRRTRRRPRRARPRRRSGRSRSRPRAPRPAPSAAGATSWPDGAVMPGPTPGRRRPRPRAASSWRTCRRSRRSRCRFATSKSTPRGSRAERDRAEPEQQGRHVDPSPPRGTGSRAGARARTTSPATSAPTIDRTPHVTTIASHTMPISTLKELTVARPIVTAKRLAAEAGDERAQAEGDQLRPHDADADRGRRVLARAHRRRSTIPVVDRRRLARRARRRRRTRPRAGGRSSTRSSKSMPKSSGRAISTPAPKLSKSSRAKTSVSTSSDERERREREVEVAEPEAQRGDEQPDRHHERGAGEDRQPDRPARVGRQLRGRERADPGEGDLAQRQHAALAGDDREREEEDAERDALAHHPDPEVVEPQRHREQREGHGQRADRGPPARAAGGRRGSSGRGLRRGADVDLELPRAAGPGSASRKTSITMNGMLGRNPSASTPVVGQEPLARHAPARAR